MQQNETTSTERQIMNLFDAIMAAAEEDDSLNGLEVVAKSIGIDIPDDATANAKAQSDDNNWATATHEDRVATMMRAAAMIVSTIMPVTYLMQKMQAATEAEAPDGDAPSSEVGVS